MSDNTVRTGTPSVFGTRPLAIAGEHAQNPDEAHQTQHTRQRAIVLGASVGGLLAARVLADFYRTVTVVERDVLPEGPVNRRGPAGQADPRPGCAWRADFGRAVPRLSG
jgi:hypothetical protein